MFKVTVPRQSKLPWVTITWEVGDDLQESILANRAKNPYLLIMATSGQWHATRWWFMGLVPLYQKRARIEFSIPGNYKLHVRALYDHRGHIPDVKQVPLSEDGIGRLEYPLDYLNHAYADLTVSQEYFAKSAWEQWVLRHPRLASVPKRFVQWLNSSA